MPAVLPRSVVRAVLSTVCVLAGACSPPADPGVSEVFVLDAGNDQPGSEAGATPGHVQPGDSAQQTVGDGADQPITKPTGECDASACVASKDTKLSGTVHGLVGSGLVLASATGEQLAVEVDGPFQFAKSVPFHASYAITVAVQPASPEQTCVVTSGTGVGSGVDIGDLSVSCTTRTFRLSARVSGLTGAGLELTAQVGERFLVSSTGDTMFPFPLPDGFAYKVEVARQPSSPDQRCYVVQGAGVLHADATVMVSCDPLSGLRIAEVGACPYSNSACWFELQNAGIEDVLLDDYRVRTSALAANAYIADRTFDLPNLTVAAGATVVLQAKTARAQPDGSNVFHYADGATVPWWSASGFVELLNPEGGTEDFVRFGSSNAEPTTSATWAGGYAPPLPTGQGGYGYSIAHARTPRAVSSSSDWRLSSFATYAGINDITSDTDSDRDGIPDEAEVPGGTYAGLDLYAMGARVSQRDVFVEIDRMDSTDPAVIPRRAALDKVAAVFAARGIKVHFDAGDLFAQSFDPTSYNLGGGTKVPFAEEIGFAPADSTVADVYAYKAKYMSGARRAVFYYMMFGAMQEANEDGGRSSGVGEVPGNDTIITLAGFSLNLNNSVQRNLLTNYQAATMMHELGHNLGLRHGGSDSRNLKPNYISVMNYLYSPIGLPTIGSSEGDRFDLTRRCSLVSVVQLTNPPTGDASNFVLDFSDGQSGDMDENAVVERSGLGRSNSRAVDFNCNQKTDSAYKQDLNKDKLFEVLHDNDDWAQLDFIFRRTTAGNDNGPSLLYRVAALPSHGDALTDDSEHSLDPPCPGLPVF